MEIIKFETYHQYKREQFRTVKSRRRNGFSSKEIQLACDYLKAHGALSTPSPFGICHGVRNGLEADEFVAHLPSATVIGTDLFLSTKLIPDGYTHKCKMVEWDFSVANPEWTEKMDWVYSNALDHSRDPQATLKTWVEQLKPTGFVLIKWTTISTGVHGGDCFSCDLNEMLTLANQVGRVNDLIYLGGSNRRSTHYVLIVIGKPIIMAPSRREMLKALKEKRRARNAKKSLSTP